MQTGIDIGSSGIKLVLIEEGQIIRKLEVRHNGNWKKALLGLLSPLCKEYPQAAVVLTGSYRSELEAMVPKSAVLDDIPAIVEGVHRSVPSAGSVIEIGSQNARFITGLSGKVPRFAVNEHCAGGTGSFFEDQMSRLGLEITDFSSIVEQAVSIPRISGRCAVFAKSDIIHRQQEGTTTPDILLGLCYAMVRNYKAVIVKGLEVEKPVVLSGGICRNSGVVRAVKEVFSLSDSELIIPPDFTCISALGAAFTAASSTLTLEELVKTVSEALEKRGFETLPPLKECTRPSDPVATKMMSSSGCFIGIDIGSVSTDLLLMDKEGGIIDYLYLRTRGNGEKAVREGLETFRERYGEISFLAAGVTGSGRDRIARIFKADCVRDEITAQAEAAVYLYPEADTVFEIGGQDSKYISIENGNVRDYQMNRICAAGTGAFIEETAARLGVPISEFGPLALTSPHPAALGERCTVFISTAMTSAMSEGADKADIAAGLCTSVVRNYLHKVVGSRRIGNNIILQGGIAYNSAIISAFRAETGREITVSRLFPVSGAYGSALLARKGWKEGTVSAFGKEGAEETHSIESSAENKVVYNKAQQLLLEGYDGRLDPGKKTVGIPFVLMIHKFFPLANAFFRTLGYNVLLSGYSDEEIVRLSQEHAAAETCYPVKLIYGHMQKLVEAGVDYIFLPRIHTMKHESSQVAHNYGCVYMQTAPCFVSATLGLEEKGIRLLSPVFDLDFGKEAMAMAMLSVAKELGIARPLALPALMKGAMAVRKHTAAVEEMGAKLLSSLRPDEKVLVLISRNYGLSDPILNMGIPKILLEKGYKVLTLSHLPAHDIDISSEYPNLYWPFGQHIISGMKIVAEQPQLYAVYLTNHGCGPDTMMTHLVKEIMKDKPYLEIEVDEHFSKVGTITRIEAFLSALEERESRSEAAMPLSTVTLKKSQLISEPEDSRTLLIPSLGKYSSYIAKYYEESYGVRTRVVSEDSYSLSLGRSVCVTKEYQEFVSIIGMLLREAESGEELQFLLPQNEGSDADGEYAKSAESILRLKGITNVTLVSPMLEELTKAKNADLLMRAIMTGDLLYATGTEKLPDHILSKEELKELSGRIRRTEHLLFLGSPFTLYNDRDGIISRVEAEGRSVQRMPLSEYLLMLTEDSERDAAGLKELLEPASFSDYEKLRATADSALPRFAGANGRYRLAKELTADSSVKAVITLSPRYENTETIIELTERGRVSVPVYHIESDGDKDESLWTNLSSFLYYL